MVCGPAWCETNIISRDISQPHRPYCRTICGWVAGGGIYGTTPSLQVRARYVASCDVEFTELHGTRPPREH